MDGSVHYSYNDQAFFDVHPNSTVTSNYLDLASRPSVLSPTWKQMQDTRENYSKTMRLERRSNPACNMFRDFFNGCSVQDGNDGNKVVVEYGSSLSTYKHPASIIDTEEEEDSGSTMSLEPSASLDHAIGSLYDLNSQSSGHIQYTTDDRYTSDADLRNTDDSIFADGGAQILGDPGVNCPHQVELSRSSHGEEELIQDQMEIIYDQMYVIQEEVEHPPVQADIQGQADIQNQQQLETRKSSR
ncbi:hypothetical protein K7X08_033457 [Anisodus acutangulus]|uniref:Uncharacterized protein n=1 Tax=Anisodus acutangulus TaxID=402998 RepID=A0A9Q1RA46_9SOLA|nr:hypothetical protein K7X08_033457 [Anisodus acutangulus]